MIKCKCEYYSKITGEKEIAIMEDRFDFIAILNENNVDLEKEVKIFEKHDKWILAHYIVNGETTYKNYTIDESKRLAKCNNKVSIDDNLFDLVKSINKNICQTRKETQSNLDIMFDCIFRKEDISKPKLKVIETSI